MYLVPLLVVCPPALNDSFQMANVYGFEISMVILQARHILCCHANQQIGVAVILFSTCLQVSELAGAGAKFLSKEITSRRVACSESHAFAPKISWIGLRVQALQTLRVCARFVRHMLPA